MGTADYDPVQEVERLKNAIRKHRDQRGDDRCWLDDAELYTVLGEEQPNTALPPKEKFLANCARYYECRQNPNHHYETEAERTQTLRELLKQSLRTLAKWRKSWTVPDRREAIQLRVEASDEMMDLRVKARSFLPADEVFSDV